MRYITFYKTQQTFFRDGPYGTFFQCLNIKLCGFVCKKAINSRNKRILITKPNSVFLFGINGKHPNTAINDKENSRIRLPSVIR